MALILTGGRIYTGDTLRPWAEGIAIDGETISAIGTDDQVRQLAGNATRVIDLGGKLVVPGINDAHVHAPWSTEASTSVTLDEVSTREQLIEALERATAEAASGAMLVAELPLPLVDVALTRDDLDRISSSHRLRVSRPGGHSALLNTLALRDWGVEEDAIDPPGGTYGRDAQGRLDGWLYEHAYWPPQLRVAASAGDDELRAVITSFEDVALRHGITSVQTMATVPPERLEALLASMTPRLRWRIIDFRMAPYDVPPGRFPVKYVLDGTPFERSVAMREPYSDRAGTDGGINYSQADIESMVRDASLGERQLLVHAVGDRTLEVLLRTMGRMETDWPALRVRIEHGDLLAPDLVPLAKELGLVLVQNPAHFMIPEIMHSRFGRSRSGWTQPARSLLDEGIPFALGSDGPLNPWLNMMFAAIHPVNQNESLTIEQALRAYTSGAAFAEFEERRKGTLSPGRLADLAVLSQDVFAVPPDQLPGTTSVMTVVGGKIVYEAENGGR
ncbi:MAG: amidohydrolase [Thermoanaerobaculia bacterium]